VLRDKNYKFFKFKIVEHYDFKRKGTIRVERRKQKMQKNDRYTVKRNQLQDVEGKCR
jgi:hypothetical protein